MSHTIIICFDNTSPLDIYIKQMLYHYTKIYIVCTKRECPRTRPKKSWSYDFLSWQKNKGSIFGSKSGASISLKDRVIIIWLFQHAPHCDMDMRSTLFWWSFVPVGSKGYKKFECYFSINLHSFHPKIVATYLKEIGASKFDSRYETIWSWIFFNIHVSSINTKFCLKQL